MKSFVEIDDKFIPAHQLPASIIDLAMARGINMQKFLRGTGIFYEDIKKQNLYVSPVQTLSLIEKAQQQIAGYDSSFLLGQRLFPGNYGHLSEALMHSKNLHDFLRILFCHLTEINPFIHAQVSQCNDKLVVQFSDAIGCGENYPFLLEMYLTALSSTLKYLAKQRITIAYQFSYKRPRYIQEYEENLGFKISFEQADDMLFLSINDFEISFPRYSQLIRAHALNKLKQQKTQKKITFLQAILRLQKLYGPLTQEEAACKLGLSTATFKRKLKRHNTRYLALQDLYHRQQTVIYLLNHHNNNEMLAAEMGFTDVANFRRAFKRWFKMTPSEFKSRYQLSTC
ncbi:AraC family transcriptional regulator [Catenovulum sediminis]|uniref:AraC family transcriptional regulator ligand-binding domain-containing protein n=1 Tax=Catenovulum sediminis TaxID=1740262 RepID=A0ABV1RDG7_9ALTE|nr:AraC family transcriptional regulator [Catenovulum sediminis]